MWILLSKIIEEDSTRSEDEYNKLNRKVISLCDEIIKLIRNPRSWYSLSRLSSQFEEKRLLSKIWIWNSYTREIKESIVKEIFAYRGTNPIINNISQIVKLYKNMGENKELNNAYILFGKFKIINSDEVLKSMLFIHYPLKTQINEIILGPKMTEGDFYAPYILKKIKGMNDEKVYTEHS